jgi:hypothetical protein
VDADNCFAQYLGSGDRDSPIRETYRTKQVQTAENVSYRGIVQIEQIGNGSTTQFCGVLAPRTQQQGSHLCGGAGFIKIGDACPHLGKPSQHAGRPSVDPTIMHCRGEHVSWYRDHRCVRHRDRIPRDGFVQQRWYRAAEFMTQGKSENRSTAAVITDHSYRSPFN